MNGDDDSEMEPVDANELFSLDSEGNLAETENASAACNERREIFDLSLPSQHSYLGLEMEYLSGRTILDDAACIKLPLLSNLAEFKAAVIPGQTIPLSIYHPGEVSMIKKVIEKDRTFGIRLEIGNVQILPEIELSAPLQSIQLWRSINKQFPENVDRENPSAWHKESQKYLLTPWPSWVYKQYLPLHLVMRILQHLKESRMSEQLKLIVPKDPQQLSYWLAANLPLDNRHRLALLALNCTIQRLRYLLSILEKWKMMICRQCGESISLQHQLLPMSLEGPQGAYINSYGYVHETLTVGEAQNLQLIGNPYCEYSWFPGYAWHVAQCASCHNHIGWKFLATNNNLKPAYFWGLSRRSITAQLVPQQGRPLQPVI